MFNYLFAFGIVSAAFITGSGRKFDSFCNAEEPIEIDVTAIGSGNVVHSNAGSRKSWIVKINEYDEHGINVFLNSFVLEESFLVMREAIAISPSGQIQFVSGANSRKLKFLIPYAKSLYMEICPENDGTGNGYFNVSYQREVPNYGEGPLPNDPPELEKAGQTVEIQFRGKKPEEFVDECFISKFKKAVKAIADDYCSRTGIPFDREKSASDMVTIHKVRQCPFAWAYSEICVSVNHSVFASGGDDLDRKIWEYQLTRTNLQKMWSEADNTHLKQIGLSVYLPDVESSAIGWWFLAVLLPLFLIIGLAFSLYLCYRNVIADFTRQNKCTDLVEEHNVEKRRKNRLRPNKFQQVPLFITEDKPINVRDGRGTATTANKSYYASLLLPRNSLAETTTEYVMNLL